MPLVVMKLPDSTTKFFMQTVYGKKSAALNARRGRVDGFEESGYTTSPFDIPHHIDHYIRYVPSATYACSGSPLILLNSSTAMERGGAPLLFASCACAAISGSGEALGWSCQARPATNSAIAAMPANTRRRVRVRVTLVGTTGDEFAGSSTEAGKGRRDSFSSSRQIFGIHLVGAATT
jgi:hypothetical protein